MTQYEAAQLLDNGKQLQYIQPVNSDDILYTAVMEAPNDYRMYAKHTVSGFEYRPMWCANSRSLLVTMMQKAPLSQWTERP